MSVRKGKARYLGRQEAIVTEPDRNGIASRLWSLPGQLLLALINATSILVIVAAILALVAIARIDHFAENVVATMTEAVLSKVDLPPKDVLANLRNLRAEVRTLGNSLREINSREHSALQSEIAQLKEALTVLNISVERLGSARSVLTDEAIGQLGRTVTDALTKLRDCSSSARQVAPHRTLRNKTVETWGPAGPLEAGHEN
jgi:DNA-binding protein H-NS